MHHKHMDVFGSASVALQRIVNRDIGQQFVEAFEDNLRAGGLLRQDFDARDFEQVAHQGNTGLVE
ncbi:hypothetical protein RZS08_43775, partial [Arthrospira platensis SPKY1]|nr:hypothetical protein [Arthrospira platensis SPKY1]